MVICFSLLTLGSGCLTALLLLLLVPDSFLGTLFVHCSPIPYPFLFSLCLLLFHLSQGPFAHLLISSVCSPSLPPPPLPASLPILPPFPVFPPSPSPHSHSLPFPLAPSPSLCSLPIPHPPYPTFAPPPPPPRPCSVPLPPRLSPHPVHSVLLPACSLSLPVASQNPKPTTPNMNTPSC